MMVCRALFPPKHHYLRLLLRPAISELRAVSCRRGRLLGTAAAQKVPVAGATPKRVPKEVRKAMVKEYVSKYRTMNGGKFPSASVIRKEVGGCFYTVRAMLQELEFKLATMETKNDNQIAAGETDEVSGISPLSSKEVDNTSEIGEVLNTEVLLGTAKEKIGTTLASTINRISADNDTNCVRESSNTTDERVIDNKSIVPHCNELSIENEKSGQTAEVSGIYEVGEVIDSEEQVDTTSASKNVKNLVDSSTSSQGEVIDGSGHMMVDTPIFNSYSEVPDKDKDVSPKVGQTDKNNGISKDVLDSEVRAGTSSVSNDVGILVNGGASSQGKAIKDSGPMVYASISNKYVEEAAKHESSRVGQIAKTSGSSNVREVLDSEKQVCTTIASNDSGIKAGDNSSSQREGSDNRSQTMVNSSNATNYDDVSSKEDSEFPSKTGYHPSEVVGSRRSTDLGKIDETSSEASKSDQLTRENNQDEAQKTSIWGNLKSFASSIISIWRR